MAKFASLHFTQELKKSEYFQKGDYENALVNTFKKLDEIMLLPENKKELLSYKNGDSGMGEESFAGCTANVILIAKQEVIFTTILIRNFEGFFTINSNREIELKLR